MNTNHFVSTNDSSSSHSLEVAYENAELFLESNGMEICFLDHRSIRKAPTAPPHLQGEVSINRGSFPELKNIGCSQLLNRRRKTI